MKILSIHDGHNASAAVCTNDEVISAVSEERINRKKFYWGWPERSIAYVLEDAKITLEEIDVVTVSHLDTLGYIRRKMQLRHFYTWKPKLILGHFFNIFQALKRERKVRTLFKGKKKKPVFFFCDHHLAHAASAYYFSGFEDALVVTIDGLGDSLSHTAYEVRSGVWAKLIDGGAGASLGAFYGAVTKGLGFTENRHEGKVVGLAAMGNPKIVGDAIGDYYITLSDNALHFTRRGHQEMEAKVRELLRQGFTREDIAAHAQDLLERTVVAHIKRLYAEGNKPPYIALAGGVFSNVKLNQKILEECSVEKVFIQPAMGDEGLVLGSAQYYLANFGGYRRKTPLKHVYFGHEYSDSHIEGLLKKTGYTYEVASNTSEQVAELLEQEKIVGWFDGRMEFGPRALGHRTMMANPRRKEINDELNRRLRRSEFMPFAPSVLYDQASRVFSNMDGAEHTAEFMTITFTVRSEWVDKIRAVVHVDNTARPQLVRPETNAAYYNAINAFYIRTGIPLIVNTSFNMHEEPIVCSPEDALRSFEDGAVDYLIFNNKFIISRS